MGVCTKVCGYVLDVVSREREVVDDLGAPVGVEE